MKIEKINENQIRCTLTRADLEERHIRLSELAYGSENAKSLFRDMMQQANLEFGFEADNTPLMIEAIPVSSDSIILIVSKVDDPEELDTRFSKFTPFGNSGQSTDEAPPVEVEGADDILDIFQKIYEAKSRAMERKKKEKAASETIDKPKKAETAEEAPVSVNLMREYTFRNLDTVIEAAHGLNHFFQGFSALYKNEKDGTYYLILRQEKTPPEDFNKVCNMLSEYGKGIAFSPAKQAYLEEHGGCMISHNALTQLTKI
ncbi:MAG TPA: adaptor protein MecA [Candidatus Blautia stercoravium]|nr:adaptor protein MecA [Candidatus Blautia stercoravium]